MRKLIVVALLALAGGREPADAQEGFAFNLQPGDKFCYEIKGGNNHGRKWCNSYVGPRELVSDWKGGELQFLYNPDGSRSSNGYRTFTSDTNRPWPLAEGKKWSRIVTVGGLAGDYKYTETCEVEAAESIVTQAGTFTARRIECEEQRLDRDLPAFITYWFDVVTGMEVGRETKWYGSDPGRIDNFLTSVERAEPQN